MPIKINSYISCFIKTSFICFCGIGFNKILGFLDTKWAGIKYKEHSTINFNLIWSIRGPKRSKRSEWDSLTNFKPKSKHKNMEFRQPIRFMIFRIMSKFGSILTNQNLKIHFTISGSTFQSFHFILICAVWLILEVNFSM